MPNYYLAPKPFGPKSSATDQIGWVTEAVQSGMAFLKSQPAYPFIQSGLNLIDGKDEGDPSPSLSRAHSDLTIRNLRELIAAQTNIRVIPSFKTELSDYKKQQTLLNKMYMAWQSGTFADRSLRKAWQYASAAGTGYVGLRWDKDYWKAGRGDIVMDAYGPLDVLPIGLPKNHRLKDAYCTILRVQTPYHQVLRTWPEFADQIKPSKDTSALKGSIVSEAVRLASLVLQRFGQGRVDQKDPVPWETVDVYYLYINDDAVNDTGQEIQMGDPGTSWSFKVPYIGQPLKTGVKDGQYETREATREDCKLYPTGRLIKSLDSVVLNPDPTAQVNPYWGGLPLVQFRADDWAWNFLGFPLTRYGQSLETANTSILRGVVDSINARLSPPRAYDRNTMAQSLAEAIDPRIPNTVVGMDMTYSGDQLKPLLPSDYYNFPPQVLDFIQRNEARITHQMGVADAAALARARQLPSGDSTERIMEALGPLVKDQSRNMESSIRDMGEFWKYMAFQFYNAPRRFSILGEQGLTDEDLEYKQGDLVPEVVPGQSPDMDRFGRARLHAGNFTFTVTPYSLHELNSISRKLFHLQLVRAGFPVDWWTLAAIFDIHDFGAVPKTKNEETGEETEANTVLERWILQKQIEARMAAALQGQGQGGQGGPGHGRGRPPTGQNPPSLEQKSDGRSVVRESKK